jgi:hypothetical protein
MGGLTIELTTRIPTGCRRLKGNNCTQRRSNQRKLLKRKAIITDNVIINLSSYALSYAELSVINKGLGFVPSHLKPKMEVINSDMLRFERKLQLFYFFKDEPNLPSNPTLVGKSNWWPRVLNGHITKCCHDIKEDMFHALSKIKAKLNLNRNEIKALKDLKKNTIIIIKKCDKGGGIAVLDRALYSNKIYCMLEDLTTYKKTDLDDTLEVKSKADTLIVMVYEKGLLDKKQVNYLTNFVPRCPLFYGLPKVHKTGVPLRPICSQINGPTCRLNELVDKYLTVAEKNIPFMLQDTTAFLLLIEANKIVLPGSILCTVDVTSLYTCIPHEEGARWVSDFYEESLDDWSSFFTDLRPVDKQTLYELIICILKNCTFEFDNHYYSQLFGTTMGAKFSVKFANIYMHCWLRKFVKAYNRATPKFIARLIDDCFWIWEHGENELLLFIKYLNSCHDSIKFEATYSTEKVNFLDTVTYIVNNELHTTVYTKPTDKKQYLHFNSSHPKHTMNAIPYSQALRYRRIIDSDTILCDELETLCRNFLGRGYPSLLLMQTCDRVKQLDRNEALQYKSNTVKQSDFMSFLKGKCFLPCIVPYHPAFATVLKQSISKHWNVLKSSNVKNSAVFRDELPQVVFKKGVTIGSLLTCTKFTQSLDSQDLENIEILNELMNDDMTEVITNILPCYTPRCKCCDQLECSTRFYSDGKVINITTHGVFTCNSSNVIYIISCTKCKLLYVGQTARKLKERLNNHRSDIKLSKSTAVGIHFNLPLHSQANLRITPILDISACDQIERNKWELRYMDVLHTKYPYGMNFYPIIQD